MMSLRDSNLFEMSQDGFWRIKINSKDASDSFSFEEPKNRPSISPIYSNNFEAKRKKQVGKNLGRNPSSNSQIKFKKRNKRRYETYSHIIEKLERSSQNFSKQMKNPFKRIKKEDDEDAFLESLGDADKILGILQTYNYFAPLSKFCFIS